MLGERDATMSKAYHQSENRSLLDDVEDKWAIAVVDAKCPIAEHGLNAVGEAIAETGRDIPVEIGVARSNESRSVQKLDRHRFITIL